MAERWMVSEKDVDDIGRMIESMGCWGLSETRDAPCGGVGRCVMSRCAVSKE